MARSLATTEKRWLLSAHLLLSVAWFGTAACFLVLSIVAAGTHDESVLRAAYTGIEILERTLVRPLAVGTVATGVMLSLLTRWGLFRFYWLIAKEIVSVLIIAAGVVVMNRVPAAILATVSTAGLKALQNPAYQSSQSVLLVYVALEVVLLAASVVISVFKPFGQRSEHGARYSRSPLRLPGDEPKEPPIPVTPSSRP